MRTIWHSLVWKEWRENAWKLTSIICVLFGVTSLSMFLVDEDRFDTAVGLLIPCMVPLALFVGLGTAASERSRGTLPFVQSLPVPMWQVALVKFVAGLITIIVPVLLTVLSFYIWRQ